MPIYEYECPECGCFEVVQKATDKPLKCNPDCQNKKCPKSAKRLISASAFHLKGSGWYKTDYAKSGSAGTKSSGSKKNAGTSDAKSETKSESSGASAKTETSAAACGKGCGCH